MKFRLGERARLVRARVLMLAMAMVASGLVALAGPAPVAAQPGPCDEPVVNEIICENSLPGNPESEWGISGAGSPEIQGFATDISVDQGGTVDFKIDTTASAYRLDIYRMGYYGGDGARFIASVNPTSVTNQPNCLNDAATGLIDCGNWSVSASWTVPGDAVSGIYFAKLVRTDGPAGSSHVFFVVRDDDGGSDLLFQTSDTTWQAYNEYGGNSLYTGSPANRAYKVSYNRPFTTRDYAPEDWVFNAEYPMVRFLERNGYDVSYTTGIDTDRLGAELLEHDVFLSVGHDEYWSGAQRANVEAARAAGVHLAFFSGNEVFWKTRWETSIDGSGTPYRTLVTYKETLDGAITDPAHPTWTGTWRDARFSPPADGGRPENELTGQIFQVNCCEIDMELNAADGAMRFWRNTRVAALTGNQTTTVGNQIIGYEWDEDVDNGFRPPGLFRVSETSGSGLDVLQDEGSVYGPGSATHSMTMYKAPSGALVFGAGTVQWAWGLDDIHDRGPVSTADDAARQATVNLFADMGVQPASLQAGLVPASASTDTQAPTAAISSPADGSTVGTNSVVLVTGTAADVGGEVGAVEVSTDGGATWTRADGRGSWTHSFNAPFSGTVDVMARAVDDSANLGAATTITLTVDNTVTCPCSIWTPSATPDQADPSNNATEVGVKFQSAIDGYITGLRFYRSAETTGAVTGHLWDSSGALLATVPFAGTTTGWHEELLPNPVPITADVTYVASYHAPNGRYSVSGGYFNGSGASNGPLTAPADGVAGGNGVYAFGPSGTFPSNTFQSENYWVDVVFDTTAEDTTAPTVLSTVPVANASGAAANGNISATFSEPVSEATITMTVTGPGGAVAGATSYDVGARRYTFDPSSDLSYDTVYTVDVSGATDGSGNVMAPMSWSFTTSGPPPPLPTEGPGGPIGVVTSGGDAFSGYFAEILRGEGLNEFESFDITALDAAKLASYTTVILGPVPLTTGQVADLTTWVNGGGNLIASKPDVQLASLLGLSPVGSTLSEGYLQVDTSSEPGTGIVGQTMQFHGTADRYTLAGADAVATLYSSATASTSNPAVTLRDVGSNGGQAAAFTYELARSIVYTRQGNPAWVGQERDGVNNIRSSDLFVGGTEADWVDLDKVAIPQADEQQRLLANLIQVMNRDVHPLPRFWYFPDEHQAVVVATGDDHGNNGTATRFDSYLAASPPGCSVVDWECHRFTSYIYANTPLGDSAAASYEQAGFEVALHASNGCTDFNDDQEIRTAWTSDLADFQSSFPSVSAPVTSRFHCIIWSDWDTQAVVGAEFGIRLDTNYYYFPDTFVGDRPGFMTGSGMPQRFARLDGTMIDVYQGATQLTDESGQAYPFTPDTLLDRALGAEGYYGYFVANMHTDFGTIQQDTALLNSAAVRGVPVVTSRQVLDFVDGRNASSFQNLSWSTDTLGFDISVGAGAANLTAMVPLAGPGGSTLAGITRGGSTVSYGVRSIKGLGYAVFPAAAGSYAATYGSGGDTTPPTVTSTDPADGATAVATSTTASATFSESVVESSIVMSLTPAGGSAVSATVSYDDGTRTATLTPSGALAADTTYTVDVSGATDVAGNAMTPVSWSFTTATAGSCPCSIWDASTVPATPSANDPNAVELGVKFQASQSGYVTGVRFYKGPSNAGTHVGNLWTESGVNLATVTFTGETAAGWQQASFATPVAVTAGTTYVVSYHAPNGGYAAESGGLASEVVNGPLTALADGASGGNGLYQYGASGFPTNSFGSSNYFVDVVFETSAPVDTTPPTVTSTDPADGATDVATSTVVSATFSESVVGSSIVMSLTPAGGSAVSATVSYDDGTRTATLTPAAALTDGTTYTVDVSGATDASGNTMTPVSSTFTTAAGVACPCSIWDGSTVPATPSANDPNAVELGAKFQASQSGYVTGVRFYKGPSNTGTHVGNLWSAAGANLGSVTFTGETASGWQEASFATPVAVTAGTTYVVSYHAPNGGYAAESGGLASDVVNGPLTALASGASGGNGVYAYGGGGFPSNTFGSTNYFVDVVFQTTAPVDTTPPTVTSTDPADGATFVAASTTASATFSESVVESSIVMSLTPAGGSAVSATVSYDDGTRTATLTPAADLADDTTYTVDVSGATDAAGNAMTPVSWTFTTAPAGLCPCSIWDASTVPATPSANDPGAVELGVKFQASQSGYVTGVRFYKGPSNTGTHVGNLWTASGTNLGSVTFTGETASGWQEASFATPVAVTAGTTYVVSYHAPNGGYAAESGGLASEVVNGPLTALADGAAGGNGVYAYGGGGFPSNTYGSSNYFVDIVFQITAP